MTVHQTANVRKRSSLKRYSLVCIFLFLFTASFTMSAAILTYFPAKGRADAIWYSFKSTK